MGQSRTGNPKAVGRLFYESVIKVSLEMKKSETESWDR